MCPIKKSMLSYLNVLENNYKKMIKTINTEDFLLVKQILNVES